MKHTCNVHCTPQKKVFSILFRCLIWMLDWC
uniref:Uncharacterized protein n=1 Tax=Arundo donax TaxID=35708 RepID=A0A0A9H8Q5_ARUDO